MPHPVPLDRRSLLASALLLTVVVVIAGGMALYVVSDERFEQAHSMMTVAVLVDQLYPSAHDRDESIERARRALFEPLDRYSTYMDTDRFERMDEELSGSYRGIGISVVRHDKGLMILSVREGGPADAAGLLTGDLIITADGVELSGESIDISSSRLRGEEGTSVRLSLERPGSGDSLSVEVTRGRIPLLHIPYAGIAGDSLIYIRLLDFEAGATDDIEAAIDSLRNRLSSAPRGLILDLRGNPGGLFSEAYRTADLFLNDGTLIVGTDGRSRWNDRTYRASGEDIIDGIPMAVIVDGNSASSAEIVAGALKLSNRALLVGDTTFGKGLVQGFLRYPEGDGLRLTISRYYFEGDVYLNPSDSISSVDGRGLAPDVFYEYADQNPFLRAVESSLLLQQYVGLYSDRIIDSMGSGESAADLVSSFAIYARQQGFEFASDITESALRLKSTAEKKGRSKRLIETTRHLYANSVEADRTLFYDYRDRICSRLRQIAVAGKLGQYYAYRDVVVPGHGVIKLAATRLLEED